MARNIKFIYFYYFVLILYFQVFFVQYIETDSKPSSLENSIDQAKAFEFKL